MEGKCELCERDEDTTFHHLIPRKHHNKDWCKRMFTKEEMKSRGIDLCGDCHSAVHTFIDHKLMVRIYNTKEKLLSHPEIIKFVAWVCRQNKKAKK